MRNFHLQRDEDATGVSGVGKVAEGVVFEHGHVVIHWLTAHESIGIYPSMDELVAIHGHEGRTRVVWDDKGRAECT